MECIRRRWRGSRRSYGPMRISLTSARVALCRPRPASLYAGYQVKAAEFLRQASGLPVISVGLITDPHQVEEITGERPRGHSAWPRVVAQPLGVLNTARDTGSITTGPRRMRVASRPADRTQENASKAALWRRFSTKLHMGHQ